jgi:hypothetical protein
MPPSSLVYLLHLARPLPGGGRHYLGTCAPGQLPVRLDRRRHGQGSKMLALANALDLGYVLVRTWPGGRALERALKARHHQDRLCPICRAAALAQHAAEQRARSARRRASRGASAPRTPVQRLISAGLLPEMEDICHP